MKILVSGANGFIGRALCPYLASRDYTVVPAVRRAHHLATEYVVDSQAAWQNALQGCDSVVHLAGRAHVMQDTAENPLQVFRAVNVDATLALAQRCVDAGVRRFIFMSTIKVNGECTAEGMRFSPHDTPAPQDPYAISKWEAELGLRAIAKASGLEVVTIRPPLVYGPHVKGNMATLIHGVTSGFPLPLGAVNNRRSMIALDNLISFIALCADPVASPRAAGEVFTVCDGEDVSTTELLRKIAWTHACPSRLLPVPTRLLRLVAKLLGKSGAADRLLGSLAIDNAYACELLGWRPEISMNDQLRKMADAASH